MAWEELKPSGRGGSSKCESLVRLGVYMPKSRNAKPQITVRIAKSLAAEYRLVIGDRCKVLFDWHLRLGLVVRVPSGGWSFSPAGGAPLDKSVGKSEAGAIKATIAREWVAALFPDGYEPFATDEARVMDEGIVFSLPPETKH